MSFFNKEKVAQYLVTEGLIKQEALDETAELARKEKKSVFQILIDKEAISADKIIRFLSDYLSMPCLNLANIRIPKEVLNIVPKKIIERYHVMPIGRIGNSITIATSDPFELLLVDDIHEITGCKVVYVLATPEMIMNTTENYFGAQTNFDEILGGIDDDSVEVVNGEEEFDTPGSDDRSAAEDAPVIRMVNVILAEGIKQRASDIHFEPYEKNFRVRYRIDGSLKEAYAYSRELYTAIVARMKIMSSLDITEKRLPQDGRFRVGIHQKEIDFRVSILPIYHGEKVVLRVLDRSSMKSGLDKLGFSEKPTEVFADAIKRPYGMILVTGPTGSGKSTTLYTILNTMNTLDRNIMTIEDPVEYQVEGITQTQVRSEVGLTFASGLRCLLRQSPDVILVGEMRDTETADIGVKAALTGHLVFSTLHTNSAAGAVTRLVDMGVEPFLIASSVICVAAQRLLRRICPNCKVEVELSEDSLRRSGVSKEKLKGVKAYEGKGCARCNQTGYFGRIGATEVMKMDGEIQEMIIQRKSSDEIEKVARKNNMQTLFENAFELFVNGMTTLDEVLRVSSQG